ncbi:hypothetical protein AERO9A_140309 [Aeromonas salmonicida]|nr:hypothetical protein AERO9A_140309 [Aeromonas salmonicida]
MSLGVGDDADNADTTKLCQAADTGTLDQEGEYFG